MFVFAFCMLFGLKIADAMPNDQVIDLGALKAENQEVMVIAESKERSDSNSENTSRFKSKTNKDSRFSKQGGIKAKDGLKEDAQNNKPKADSSEGNTACDPQANTGKKSSMCKTQSKKLKEDDDVDGLGAGDSAKKLHDETIKDTRQGIIDIINMLDDLSDSLDEIAPEIRMKDQNEDALDMGPKDKIGTIE